MNNSLPLISVLLPIYNAAQYIQLSIDSILNQSFSNFELIIIDDCSTDHTYQILQSIHDDRIRLFKNETNIGLIKSLNYGLGLAAGKYIARMDHDDIAMPDRFKVQVDYLNKNNSCILVGSNANFIDNNGTIFRKGQTRSIHNLELKASLLFTCPFIHPGIMFRKSIISEHSITYNETLKASEDYVLYCILLNKGDFFTPEGILLHYREHASIDRVTSSKNIAAFINGRIMAWEILLDHFKIPVKKELWLLHDKFTYYQDDINEAEIVYINEYLIFLRSLIRANRSQLIFDKVHFKKQVSIRTLAVAKFLLKRNFSILPKFQYFFTLLNPLDFSKLLYLSLIH